MKKTTTGKLRKSKRMRVVLKIPNALTAKTINDAHNGIGIEGPIRNIDDFINSL